MDDTTGTRPRFSIGRLFVNCLTMLVLLATLAVGAAFAAIYLNPQLPFNPFPPPTYPPVLEFPTVSPGVEPSVTPTDTSPATSEPTATETSTPIPATETATAELPTATPTATPYPFGLQPGTVAATTSWFHGCDWMGVGGHVLDSNNAPLTGYVIQLSGELNSVPKNMEVLSGSASDILGASGYLFDLANGPIASDGTLFLQLVDGSSGLPLSEKIPLTTYDSCSKNLLLVNWRMMP